ncbi:hypothetical protein NEOLEDRAFT_1183715 [Neolentinus lepideus HHB14362 ss-1]|uniref:Protein kinase domain-containing protein n=1 Tax=Neolentinus lepideus HHB14362 ss-1 TaxID=1314782 RepID=A0A165N265_9AGAM|nr:hypothetical protein NEOLEDRAFT_1183715 [Neolentinus lepideus HHB14362 ss-1]
MSGTAATPMSSYTRRRHDHSLSPACASGRPLRTPPRLVFSPQNHVGDAMDTDDLFSPYHASVTDFSSSTKHTPERNDSPLPKSKRLSTMGPPAYPYVPSSPALRTPAKDALVRPALSSRRLNTSPPARPATTKNANASAKLPVPSFTLCTPQTKDAPSLKRQAESVTRPRGLDLDQSSDSDEEVGTQMDDDGATLFFGGGFPSEKPVPAVAMDEDDEEPPHASFVTTRRIRSPKRIQDVLKSAKSKLRLFPAQAFTSDRTTSFTARHRPRSDSSSSSEMGSPVKRPRARGTMGPPQHPVSPIPSRPPFRTTSSATLFFGGSAIPREDPDFGLESIGDTHHPHHPARHPLITIHPHEEEMSPTARYSSPPRPPDDDEEDGWDYDEELSFEGGANSSFALSIVSGSPSPKRPGAPTLPKKFMPRDSGVAFSDDESSNGFLSVPPVPSLSSSTIHSHSSGDEALVTPVFPSCGSGWPGVGVASAEESYEEVDSGIDVDTFILKTLAAGTKEDKTAKKAPGTPVKRVKTAHIGAHERPWQSAFAQKISSDFDLGFGFGGAPRKSMPAVFAPGRNGMKRGMVEGESEDEEGETEVSPTMGREAKYEGLGIGRPKGVGVGAPQMKPGWLMRRSSSGAFSSGSDNSGTFGTPTRLKAKDALLAPSRIRTQFSAAPESGLSSASTTSSGPSSASLNSPTVARFGAGRPHTIADQRPHTRRRTTSHLGENAPVASSLSLSVAPAAGRGPRQSAPIHRQRERSAPGPLYRSADEQPGRFVRDFLELDEIGRGEFGRVVKVKVRHGNGKNVYAVKISKRFEGARRRARLREEADILKRLSAAAHGRHTNVLAYIDSWEQDEQLYIQTELCENGSFAHFLWEYGRVFPRLEEARVWKIVVELSNGLRFIHDHGVIHLDLKPANILVTGEGRFKICDFGMASVWPRPLSELEGGAFEREGDKVYLAPEVLQGRYGKAADMFSLGITLLETASNIVVPDQGESWHKLRQEDFRQVDMEDSPELFSLIKSMMRTDPALRLTIGEVWAYPIVVRARKMMERMEAEARREGRDVFCASPLAAVPDRFLEEILERRVLIGDHDDDVAMDTSA